MMSKEGYHRSPGDDGPLDSLGLPPLPNTSYWYEAHSSIGSSLYPHPQHPNHNSYLVEGNPGDDRMGGYGAKIGVFEGKMAEYREPLDWWMDKDESPATGVTGPFQPMGHIDDTHYYSPTAIGVGRRLMDPGMMYRGATSPQETAGMSESFEEVMDGVSDGSDPFQSPPPLMQMPQTPTKPSAAPSPSRKKASMDSIEPDVKERGKTKKERVKEGKRCGVCGDAARSMHFGGMACDSCKAFFRRSVQSGAYKNFKCSENCNCPISKSNRKICQYCRFQKSKENGMEVSWVMSETDRMVLWKSRLAKQRQEQEEKVKEEVYGGLPHTLDPKAAEILRSLAALQEATFKSITYPDDCYGDSVEALANLFVCICKKLGLFFYRVEDFQELAKLDQSLLLKNGVGMGIYLHGAYMFDFENERWPSESNNQALVIPPVSLATLRNFTPPEAFEALMKFYRRYSKIMKDEIILALMCVIAFFQPDDPNFVHSQKIQDIQSKYLEYLQIYLHAKEGDTGVRVTFPKLLVGLADIREILEFHGKVDIKPTINHQEISSKPSMKNQMVMLKELFEKVSLGHIPEFSSVLSSKEKQEPLWNKASALQKIQGPPSNDSGQFYHPYTNQIFGRDPRTDMIITNPLENIDKFVKKHKHSFMYSANSNGSKRSDFLPQKRPHDKSLATANITELPEDWRLQDRQTDRKFHLVPKRSANAKITDDGSRSVDILLNIMQQIYSDDGHFVQSLKRDLPPHLLIKLAHKLLPS